MSSINLNDKIKVKLTEHGKDIFYHQYDELNRFCGRVVCEPKYPVEDKDGYTTMQLWQFIELYGPHVGITKPGIINPLDIIIVEGEQNEQ